MLEGQHSSFKNRLRHHMKKNRLAYCFILPVTICVAAFLIYPIIKAAIMSFQYWNVSKPKAEGHYFVGLKNYNDILNDKYFVDSVVKTLVFLAVTVPIRYLIGLGGAVLMNNTFKGRGLVRAMVILPWAIPQVVASLVWMLMYDGQYGILDHILVGLNLLDEPIHFLADKGYAFGATMLVTIWKGYPFVAIMLLAGLQSIPNEMHEACKVDGGNAWQDFIHITLPSLRPVSVVIMLLLIIWTIRDFAIVYVLTQGGPAKATEINTIYIYRMAFTNFQFGRACAAGVLMLVVALVFTVVYMKATKGGELE